MAVCLSCLGQKKIQGMGFMGEVDCRTCKGTGVQPVTVEIMEPFVEQKVATLEIKPTDSSSNRTAEIKPADSWSFDILTMKGAGIVKAETLELELEIEEEIEPEEMMVNAVEPLDSTVETKLQRFKRKYTKSGK